MHSTFHFNSATELTSDIVDAIKIAFKSKPITITVEEELDTTSYLLSNDVNKALLLKSIEEDKQGNHVAVNIDY
jgi:uncharacterized protein YlaN (UPF0358 family)